ncbi:predicted protein [Paecilomyces variotii No. 5]|uniref:Uncharacterized protein n=1 Tax=Byssochlamys spectabilis (strain No. 5 / NBRC 109023) TaxID=1356009 RepID=V5G665_BYSSN|nr:predicted protein [Paecilomyces variotii No. 5]
MSSPYTGQSTGNHPTTTARGGASAVPTPANNTGGGSGWGDEGLKKGGGSGAGGVNLGGEGLGHQQTPNPAASFGNFLGLQDQKSAAHNKFEERFEKAGGIEPPTTSEGEPTCESEDHSFANHKPGCPQTMPGWSKVKDTYNSVTKGSQV